MHHHCVCNTNNNAPGGTMHHIDKLLSRSNIYCALYGGFGGMFCGDCPLRKMHPNPFRRFWYGFVDEYYCVKGT